jgi:hypothetical protein
VTADPAGRALYPIRPVNVCSIRFCGGTWHDPEVGRPIAAPLERCAELLGVDLATAREAASNVEPYIRADGTRIWSLMQLERQLRPGRSAGAGAATSTADGSQPPTRRDRNDLPGIHDRSTRRATASLSGTFAGCVQAAGAHVASTTVGWK